MNEAGENHEEIETLRTNGAQALATIFAHYQPQLERMIRFRLDRRLWGRVDPADVLQEVYLDSAARLENFLDNASVPVFVWLRTVAAQTLINAHRRHLGVQKRDANLEISLHGAPAMATSVSLAARLVADLTSPSQAAMKDEILNDLREAFETMDPTDREVLALRHFEELSNNEVAEILGLKKAAASNRYVRALKRLKGVLSRLPSFSDAED